MINKLTDELLNKLSDEEKKVLEDTFNSEAKKIRETTEAKVKKTIEPNSEIEILRNELDALKNKEAINEALMSVPQKNRELVAELMGNDPNKLDTIKEKHGDLFKETLSASLADILNGNIPSSKVSDEELLEKYRKNEELTEDELRRALKSLNK